MQQSGREADKEDERQTRGECRQNAQGCNLFLQERQESDGELMQKLGPEHSAPGGGGRVNFWQYRDSKTDV